MTGNIKKLPDLTSENLNAIFKGVYQCVSRDQISEEFGDPQLQVLMKTLYGEQYRNYRERGEDTYRLFTVVNSLFNFEPNSEGTTLWLALILAVQELYGLTDKKLLKVMRMVTIRL